MKSTSWLVQTNVSSESPTPTLLRDACRSADRSFFEFPVPPCATVLPNLPLECHGAPIVFHGRSPLILAALRSPFKGGVFFDPERFSNDAYAQGFGDGFINADAQVLRWRDLLPVAEVTSRYVFLKPNNDYKLFTGLALHSSAIAALFSDLQSKAKSELLDQEVVIAEAKEVDGEWRFIVVDGEIVASSMYRPNCSLEVPSDVVDFAKSMVATWVPVPVFCLDIGRVNCSYKVIECNCFNASRFYAADVRAIVETVSSYQEGRTDW